jgi:hypothetical protein
VNAKCESAWLRSRGKHLGKRGGGREGGTGRRALNGVSYVKDEETCCVAYRRSWNIRFYYGSLSHVSPGDGMR